MFGLSENGWASIEVEWRVPSTWMVKNGSSNFRSGMLNIVFRELNVKANKG